MIILFGWADDAGRVALTIRDDRGEYSEEWKDFSAECRLGHLVAEQGLQNCLVDGLIAAEPPLGYRLLHSGRLVGRA